MNTFEGTVCNANKTVINFLSFKADYKKIHTLFTNKAYLVNVSPLMGSVCAVFVGVNCSDIVGEENCQRICEDGTCVKVSPASFKCICATGFSGKMLYYLSLIFVH